MRCCLPDLSNFWEYHLKWDKHHCAQIRESLLKDYRGDYTLRRPLEVSLNILAGQAYVAGAACHGDLGISPERYANHLLSVTEKHLGSSATESSASEFISGLHTSDLYLSVACAKPTNAAWKRFNFMYRSFIAKVTGSACSTVDSARTIAESISGDIFLPDASGRSRIGSYEGRSSLATWLSAVINHAAVKEQNRCNRLQQLEDLYDLVDCAEHRSIEGALRADRYASLVLDSFAVAGKSLNDKERRILVLRYKDGLQGYQIAAILGIHPSTVARRLHHIYDKLRGKTVSTLESKHQLSPLAIKECVDQIREDPDYSIESLLGSYA